MHLNNINAISDDGIISNKSNFSAPKSETLDQLYKEQLAALGNLANKKAKSKDIEICWKWLKVFNKTSNSEKMARNCLCALMQKQIEECGALKEPFTNLQNCNRNLESVFNELDELLSDNLSNQYLSSRTNDTFKLRGFKEASEQQRQLDMILQENQDILLKTEIVKLTSELQSLHTQLTEKEIEILKLKETAEKYRIESEYLEERLHMVKKSTLKNIRELLSEMGQGDMLGIPMKFFQKIFSHFPHKDKEFNDIISKYDEDLQNAFYKQMACYFDKKKYMITRYICRKYVKSKAKLREKYEQRLNTQNESHKLQLKLAKLSSFSILRQIFINFHDKFDTLEGWQILKTLEDKYQSIVNGEM